jgi:hypothetical protein
MGRSTGQEKPMIGSESVVLRWCLVLGAVLIATAWWVFGINTVLV